MNLTDKIFTDETAAREHLEALQWPHGATCPRCDGKRVTKLEGESTRPGVYKCKDCRKPFSVTVGTVFERSHIPLHKWLLATHLLASSKKGMSAHQLGRMLGLTYKSAWFMAHRIREAMIPADCGPFGKGGATVEVDETFIGNDPDAPAPKKGKQRGIKQMMKVVSLVERETGRSRSIVIDNYKLADVQRVVWENVHTEAKLMTDESSMYTAAGQWFASHETVNHSKDEYVRRSDPRIHTNTIEGFFGVFKRGMKGTYQHCGKQHLQRYMVEFDFRYSMRSALGVNDTQRAAEALRGIGGKRLTYRRIGEAAHA